MSFISTDCLHDPSEQPVPVVVNDIPGSFPLSPPQVLRYCGRRLYHHTTPSLEICNNKTETRFLAQIKSFSLSRQSRLSRRMRGSSDGQWGLTHWATGPYDITGNDILWKREKCYCSVIARCTSVYCIIFCVEMRCQEFLKLLKCLFNLHFKLNQQKIRLLDSPETDVTLTCHSNTLTYFIGI